MFFDVKQVQTFIGTYICDRCDVTWRVAKEQADGKGKHCWMCGRFGRRKTS